MMTIKELLDKGELAEAVRILGEELRNHPIDAQRRTALFELLCYSGDFTRAERQLDVLDQQNPKEASRAGVRLYRELLEAEKARSRLFADGLRPRFVLEPPPGIALHLEALDHLREGRTNEARATLDSASAGAASVRGTASGVEFDTF